MGENGRGGGGERGMGRNEGAVGGWGDEGMGGWGGDLQLGIAPPVTCSQFGGTKAFGIAGETLRQEKKTEEGAGVRRKWQWGDTTLMDAVLEIRLREQTSSDTQNVFVKVVELSVRVVVLMSSIFVINIITTIHTCRYYRLHPHRCRRQLQPSYCNHYSYPLK